MAALSSTQSGNFNSASTWGGTAPSDGDTFTINRGHKVTSWCTVLLVHQQIIDRKFFT